MAKFVLKSSKKDVEQKFYFVLKANNNKVVMTSEMYHTSQGAIDGVKAAKTAVMQIVEEDNKCFDADEIAHINHLHELNDLKKDEDSEFPKVLYQFPNGV